MTATRVIDDHIELANIGTKTHAEIEGHIQGIGNYTLPAADGNADQLLKTSGAGVLSWIDQPTGFACGSLNACNITDIGTRAHASLTGIGTSDHHVKYTNAEAVAACDTANKFFERDEVNYVAGNFVINKSTLGLIADFQMELASPLIYGGLMRASLKSTTSTYNGMFANVDFPEVRAFGTDMYVNIGKFSFMKLPGSNQSFITISVVNAALTSVTVFDIHSDKIDAKVPLVLQTTKSGATQAGAGAAAKEVWKTNGHASLPDNVLLIGV